MSSQNHNPTSKLRVCVIGATGYSGHTAVQILRRHPAVARVDAPLSARHVNEVAADCDAVLLATPAEAAAEWASQLVQRGQRVIDLSGGHRLRDPAEHQRVYGFAHPQPQVLQQAVFGFAASDADLAAAPLVANPGCYAGGMLSALAPLLAAGWLDSGGPAGRARVSVTGLSGISGAGRKATERSLYVEVAENLMPYKPLRAHQHVAEVEQALAVHVAFTPVVVPLRQGMLISGTADLRQGLQLADQDLAGLQLDGDPHWQLTTQVPDVQGVLATPLVQVWYGLDPAGQRISFVAALDNLWRGAASSAVANLNAMFGLPRDTGLTDYAPSRVLHP